MSDFWRRTLAGAALGVGTILLVALLLAVLDLARIEQSHEAAVFQQAASRLRWLLLGEIVLVLGAVGIVLWRRKSTMTRLVWLAIVVWVASALDLAFVSLAGVIPR